MNYRNWIYIISLCIFCTSCHMSIPLGGITIINSTTDSLYFEISGYKSVISGVKNRAFAEVTDLTTNTKKDTLMGWILNPNDTIRPTKLDTSYKQLAAVTNGLTILFFKRTIEKLPPDQLLTEKYIFRRVDVTPKQLDSLKYIIEIK